MGAGWGGAGHGAGELEGSGAGGGHGQPLASRTALSQPCTPSCPGALPDPLRNPAPPSFPPLCALPSTRCATPPHPTPRTRRWSTWPTSTRSTSTSSHTCRPPSPAPTARSTCRPRRTAPSSTVTGGPLPLPCVQAWRRPAALPAAAAAPRLPHPTPPHPTHPHPPAWQACTSASCAPAAPPPAPPTGGTATSTWVPPCCCRPTGACAASLQITPPDWLGSVRACQAKHTTASTVVPVGSHMQTVHHDDKPSRRSDGVSWWCAAGMCKPGCTSVLAAVRWLRVNVAVHVWWAGRGWLPAASPPPEARSSALPTSQPPLLCPRVSLQVDHRLTRRLHRGARAPGAWGHRPAPPCTWPALPCRSAMFAACNMLAVQTPPPSQLARPPTTLILHHR